MDNWRIVLTTDRFFVGYSPNPMLSVILTPHAANKSMGLIAEYFEATASRLGALPMYLVCPPKCRLSVDYFELDTPASCKALAWYVLYSNPEPSQALVRLALSDQPSAVETRSVLMSCSTTGWVEGDPNSKVSLWPSVIWQYIEDNRIVFSKLSDNPLEALRGAVTDTLIHTSELKTSWVRLTTDSDRHIPTFPATLAETVEPQQGQ
jgi:hypothetical protein